LTKRCNDIGKRTSLITESLRYSKLAEQKIVNEGNVLLPIPHMLHEPVAKELERFDINDDGL